MEFPLKKPEGNDVLQILDKNIAVLQIENRHNLRISGELEGKLDRFNDISHGLTDKLDSLRSLSKARHPIRNEIKHFADQISNSWMCINRQIWERYSKIRMASRTMHGVPLSFVLDKIKKEVSLIKTSLQIREADYDQEQVLKVIKLIGKIDEQLHSLEKCDTKLQQYLSVSKLTPQLLRLESTVDKYVSNVQLLSINKSISSDLSVFLIVSKLLTGELLSQDYVNPNHVLTENAPKKPVFIIKNVKRKTDIPALPETKILKNTERTQMC